jgi:uncharacterized protein involved in cysteine biosynthesis
MSFQDVRIIVDLMIGMMITEVLLKPVAIRYGRQFLGWVDQLIQVIPDWLHQD